MGREEQVEEREVLDSIFPEEITDVSETEFRVSIALDIPDYPEDEEPPKFLLSVRYPAEYPDVAPDLEIMAAADGGATEHFDTGDDRAHLLASVQETIQENTGMAMVFAIVSALKDAAEQLGTPVNPETFLRWRAGFLREMEEERVREEEERLAELKKAKIKEPVKLSGRQLWERGLVGKVDEGDEDDDAPVEEMEQLAVEAV
ncbi:hypothetical protein LLEC1_01543 [Akanthomyces lecanii]|uniref:RWD domain-containing protein n=1 Tax=Cordyceps confragosa TaxID=2714763 RepID=A0A179I2M5_CORDF|nr:hypothetical protein LLEC1_01543 [Akanthomyces lecanii]